MGVYVSSNANRWYVALEETYGEVPNIASVNRIPAVKLTARQLWEKRERRDKTGSRTFAGLPAGLRKRTNFVLRTYMTSWVNGSEPSYGPLFRAALGGMPLIFAGGAAAPGSTERTLRFAGPHGLSVGQGVTLGGEIRFVESVADATTVTLNAPFSGAPSAGSPIGATVTYGPGLELPSVSIFDYWTPASAVQRILCGAAVNRLRVLVNGDYHEFEFSGLAKDLIDSASFAGGEGQLVSFPAEPSPGEFDYTIIPGHLGQVWMGNAPRKFCTLTEAEVVVDNELEARDREFGCREPKGISAGMRSVTVDLEIYEVDDEATKELYQAARQRSPIGVMYQLGEAPGQLFGVYLKGLVPETPEFDDGEARLRWKFNGCRAQGTADDEVYIAFG